MNIALIIAGGSGERMHQNIPKQFLTVNECPVIIYTLKAFQQHDAIRPLVSEDIISSGSYPRDNLKRTQTPQGFPIRKICDLHRRALDAGITNSVASCTLMIEMGEEVYFSKGSEKNIKLTTVDDIDIFKALLTAQRSDWLK